MHVHVHENNDQIILHFMVITQIFHLLRGFFQHVSLFPTFHISSGENSNSLSHISTDGYCFVIYKKQR